MQINHVLIDYENVQPDVARLLEAPVFKVWVFVGVQQAKVKFDLVELLQRKGSHARVVKMTAGGRNALDFHMACYLGQLWASERDAYFHLISKDTGMDPLIGHLRQEGAKVARWADAADIPIVKAPASEARSDKLARVLEYLLSRGAQRPASLKTLVGSAAALFHPRLTDAEAGELVEELRTVGVFDFVGTKLIYGLPN